MYLKIYKYKIGDICRGFHEVASETALEDRAIQVARPNLPIRLV